MNTTHSLDCFAIFCVFVCLRVSVRSSATWSTRARWQQSRRSRSRRPTWSHCWSSGSARQQTGSATGGSSTAICALAPPRPSTSVLPSAFLQVMRALPSHETANEYFFFSYETYCVSLCVVVCVPLQTTTDSCSVLRAFSNAVSCTVKRSLTGLFLRRGLAKICSPWTNTVDQQ